VQRGAIPGILGSHADFLSGVQWVFFLIKSHLSARLRSTLIPKIL
jgi:hypothetical protein